MDVFLIVVMLVLSAFFSGSEIAFVAANRLRVEVLARRWPRLGPIVHDFLQNPARFLTTTLVGNNLALVIYSTLIAAYLDPPLEAFFANTLGLEAGARGLMVLVGQTTIASVLVLVFGEILPKSIMRETANRAIFGLALPLQLSYFLMWPLIKVAGWTSNMLVRLFKADAETFSTFMRRDFELVIEESKLSGTLDLDEEESVLVSNVFAMGTMRVKESMVPRTEMAAVEQTTTVDDFLKRCIETGYSQLPVYEDNIDHIVGVAFAPDLFRAPASLAEIIRPTQFVPESKLSKDLLQEFLSTRTSIAIVLDEYGGTAGLITLEDLLEELFGDIQDEFDTDLDELRQVAEDTYIASGRTECDELEERFAITLPEGDYETIAGYLLDRLGTIPKPKDEYVLDGYRFIILQATANRIELVKIIEE